MRTNTTRDFSEEEATPEEMNSVGYAGLGLLASLLLILLLFSFALLKWLSPA